MAASDKKNRSEQRFGRAAGGAARMASLSPEQRSQLARAAAAARWRDASEPSKQLSQALNRRQYSLLNRMQKELTTLIQQRNVLDERIRGLTKAVESFGAQGPEEVE